MYPTVNLITNCAFYPIGHIILPLGISSPTEHVSHCASYHRLCILSHRAYYNSPGSLSPTEHVIPLSISSSNQAYYPTGHFIPPGISSHCVFYSTAHLIPAPISSQRASHPSAHAIPAYSVYIIPTCMSS